MPDDYRIKIGFFRHPKTRKLRRMVGSDGVVGFLQLIEFCTENQSRTEGDLSGMDDEEIECAADWQGINGDFVRALVDVRYLDGDEMCRSIHDFRDHNPYVHSTRQRSEKAKKAAEKRYAPDNNGADSDTSSAKSELSSAKSKLSSARSELSNAPSPSPDPVPSPSPDPVPVPKPSPCPGPSQDLDLTLAPLADSVLVVVEHYRSHKPRSHPGDKERKLIRARLKDGYTVEDLCTAIDGCMASPWHQGKNKEGRAYQKLELIMRDASKVDQFVALADPQTRELQLMSETSRHAMALATNMEDF